MRWICVGLWRLLLPDTGDRGAIRYSDSPRSLQTDRWDDSWLKTLMLPIVHLSNVERPEALLNAVLDYLHAKSSDPCHALWLSTTMPGSPFPPVVGTDDFFSNNQEGFFIAPPSFRQSSFLAIVRIVALSSHFLFPLLVIF